MSFGMSNYHHHHHTIVPASRSLATARYRYEAARGFDLDDDLEFCPALLTDEELQSVSAASSDRSSNASSSPESSPLQLQSLPSSTSSSYTFSSQTQYNPAAMFNPPSHIKLQQAPSASRTRNAIPIVNPSTGMRVSSPPLQMQSGARHHQQSTLSRRLW